MKRFVMHGCLMVVLFASARFAHAENGVEGDLATKWKVNDADPKASIPSVEDRNKDPLEFAYFLQDLAARAEGAFKKSDWPNTVKYYEALGHAVPDAWIPFNRLCVAYAKVGQYEIAAGNCGKAVALPMAKVIDHVRFIEYTLLGTSFTARDVRNVEDSLAHLRKHIALHPQPAPGKAEVAAEPPAEPARKKTREELIEAVMKRRERQMLDQLAGKTQDAQGPVMHLPTQVELLNCKFAVRLRDATRLETCIGELRQLKVDERQLFPLAWAHALIAKDEARAETLLAEARGLGIPAATVASMRTEHETRFPPGLLGRGRWMFALGAVFLAAVATLAFRARRRKLGPAHV